MVLKSFVPHETAGSPAMTYLRRCKAVYDEKKRRQLVADGEPDN